jgi:GNAT superfamily N-acetyltransferase
VQGRGYRQAISVAFYAVRSLSEPIPAPHLPPGYAFARVADLPNLEGRVATEREAMPWSPATVSMYLATQQAPDYCADLDLAVIGPAGDVAAFCCFWPELESGIGVVEPIGCHPLHQRKGLGTALLYEGMRRLKTIGVREVYVGNGPVPETLDTPGAPRRLTASVGFRHVTQKLTWGRQ